MKVSTRTLAVVAAALAVVVGGGAAIAATDSSSSSSTAFFDAVARHLGISSERLEDATKAAAVDQVDAALEAGRITEAEANELKSRIESGEFPRFGLGFHGSHGGPHGIIGGKFEAAAEYLDLTVSELRERLEDDQSLADVARAEGKSVDGLKQAILNEAEKRLDQAVEDDELTEAEAQAMLERLRSRIDDLVNRTHEGHHRGEGRFGPPGDGAFFPGPNA